MAFTSAKNLGKLLMGELNESPAFTAGRREIAGLTKRRIQDLFGRMANTGMGRTGITQSALSEVYKAAGESYAQLSGQEADRRSRTIDKLLGLYQFQKEQEASEFGIGDFFGGVAGLLTGSLLGPVGAAAGSFLGEGLTGLLKGGGGKGKKSSGGYGGYQSSYGYGTTQQPMYP